MVTDPQNFIRNAPQEAHCRCLSLIALGNLRRQIRPSTSRTWEMDKKDHQSVGDLTLIPGMPVYDSDANLIAHS